jgi:hypothetical protein
MFKALNASPKKEIVTNFSGGKLTSDSGSILLGSLDKNINLTSRIDKCIADPRNPVFIDHTQQEMLAQRIYSLAMGYEDLNDQQTLRTDPALLTAIKGTTNIEEPLASSPTLCRLENRITQIEVRKLSKLPVELFIESFKEPPSEIILDFDATNDTVHGNQVGESFNAYYDEHCFLPLYVFCDTQLIWAQLRSPSRGQAHGTIAVLDYVVKQIRKSFSDVNIIFRGDSGFYSPQLLHYCERKNIHYIVGYPTNVVLKNLTLPQVTAAKELFHKSDHNEPLRIFEEYNEYQAKSWDKPRRIIVKAERLVDGANVDGKENTRYIVTDITGEPDELYENVYCARGDMENRIKEQQGMLFADRTSCHEFMANRFRLLLSSFAYILVETLRRTVLCETELATAQCNTIRLKLFKVAAVVRESVRRIVFELSTYYPYQSIWTFVRTRLESLPPRFG